MTHDIVLFGATGFVGRLVAQHLANHAPDGLAIALAGRSGDALAELRAELPERAGDWPLVVASAEDPAQMRALAESTRVVATTVGPYAKYGMPLLEACAVLGTDYCDLTGETLFVRDAADAWHETALESGARIVNSCGFDSIPSDLGVLVTADRAAADGAGELTTTTLSVRVLKGWFSGGTLDSIRGQAVTARQDAAARQILADPFSLSPNRDAEPATSQQDLDLAPPGNRVAQTLATAKAWRKRVAPTHDPDTGRWVAPYFMAGFNTRIVRRSNALSGWRYGRGFRYREVMDFGSGPKASVLANGTVAGLLGMFAGLSFEPTREVLARVLPKPGDGPSEKSRREGRFRMVIAARTTSGAAYETVFGADLDPGYDATAVMLGQSALCLALDRDRTPKGGGVLTPATALGTPLVERLRAHGFTVTTRVA
ncbi:MAG: saccharopine dehydrogenase NADP-binding domain-containing protein [Dermatophilaceae bacterium]